MVAVFISSSPAATKIVLKLESVDSGLKRKKDLVFRHGLDHCRVVALRPKMVAMETQQWWRSLQHQEFHTDLLVAATPISGGWPMQPDAETLPDAAARFAWCKSLSMVEVAYDPSHAVLVKQYLWKA